MACGEAAIVVAFMFVLVFVLRVFGRLICCNSYDGLSQTLFDSFISMF